MARARHPRAIRTFYCPLCKAPRDGEILAKHCIKIHSGWTPVLVKIEKPADADYAAGILRERGIAAANLDQLVTEEIGVGLGGKREKLAKFTKRFGGYAAIAIVGAIAFEAFEHIAEVQVLDTIIAMLD